MIPTILRIIVSRTKNIIPYIIYLFVLLIWHKWANLRTYDDPFFSNVLNTSDPLSFLYNRYMSWSSRLGVEFVLIYVGYYVELFRFLDVFVNLSILWMIIHICKIKNLWSQLFTVGLFLLYNLREMRSAGWIATMVNYMWVVAGLLLLWIMFTTYLKRNKLSYIEWTVVFLLLFFAGTHEQGLVMIFAELAVFSYSYYKKYKTIPKGLLCCFSLCGIIALSIALSPGNASRMQTSIGYTNPDWIYCSLIDKFWLGMMRFNSVLAGKGSHIFLAFSSCLFIHSISTEARRIKFNILIGVTPLIIALLYYISINNECFLNYYFVKPEDVMTIDYSVWAYYPPFITSAIVILLITIYIYRTCSINNRVLFITMFLGAVATQVLMGFTPTIYISDYRTSIFLYFALIIMSSLLFNDSIKAKQSKVWNIVYIYIIVFIFVIGIIDQINYFQLMLTIG